MTMKLAKRNIQDMLRLSFLLIFISISFLSYGQLYDDYIGAGHNEGVRVWSSSESQNSSAESTINGEGLDYEKFQASRFLAQASFGPSDEGIEQLVSSDLDYEGWIDNQLNQSTSWMLPKLWEIDEKARGYHELSSPGEDYFGPWAVHFQYTWWDNMVKGDDKLRQRMAYALSQIFVLSIESNLVDWGDNLAAYYDIFMRHSFGNYKDIMMDVTLSPSMGFYLSHLNNQKTDPERGINPDENYAREIMQLFSIGLYELNNDGSRKTDSNGDWIPTYTNTHIKGMAKVMTGLKGAKWSERAVTSMNDDQYPWGQGPDSEVPFGTDIWGIAENVPMEMEEDMHEPGTKTIVGDFVIPAGQTGMEDIEMAVDHLFNHPNVGPFVARRLIQQFVKSNPTPAYIDRVASAFNDNGSGIRGDMVAVIKAILLDEEARDCGAWSDPLHGKLREPILRKTHFLNALPHFSSSGDYWDNGVGYINEVKQAPLAAPSVFNFYLPDFQPGGEITDMNGVAPEFQIHNTQTAIGYLNSVNSWVIGWEAEWGGILTDWTGRYANCPESERNDWGACPQITENVKLEMDQLMEIELEDTEKFLNYLDIRFTHGRLSEETRQTIREAIEPIQPWNSESIPWASQWRTELALHLLLISPDYVILK